MLDISKGIYCVIEKVGLVTWILWKKWFEWKKIFIQCSLKWLNEEPSKLYFWISGKKSHDYEKESTFACESNVFARLFCVERFIRIDRFRVQTS